ncbi:MAG: ubiquinol-cytochrome c reductase iron-sulfur subunit [Desulfatiglans sp.]|jgi:Rieske Fe-S protein|nr:ubiquinol-cytochrome c reductase iron-sulfur subunit [Desulfatiglans sp.]
MAETDKHNEAALSPPRRSFLNILWAGLGILAGLELIIMIFTFLKRGKPQDRPGLTKEIIEAGCVDSFPLNSVTANIRGRFYLCRMDDGGFLALSSKCTHLGCTVPWDDNEKRFICPCHGSSFDIRGAVLTSPAPRPLDMYPIHIENNIIRVDTGNTIKRNQFLAEQPVYRKRDRL